MPITRRTAMFASAATLAMPFVARAASNTIKIGISSPVTGAAAESGRFQLTGARMAVAELNVKGVLGKQVELIVEDDQTTNPGAVLAFSRMSADSDMVGFVGSIRSTQVNAVAPDVLKIGKPFMIGGTDPTLTHMGNRWLFRCRPNDSYSAKVIAQFGVKELKKMKWAVVNSTDAFGSNGAKALIESLKALDIEPVLVQGYTNQQSDFTPVALAVRSSGADVLGSYFTFETDLGVFARQLRQLGVMIPWVGSASIVNISALNLGGRSLFGTYGVADFAVDANPVAKAYAEKYMAQMKTQPDNQSSYAYDAITILGNAINTAGSTDPEKIRAAILAVKGFMGAEGEYNFDANGDGLHGYNVVKNENGKIVYDRRIDFPA
jgi:branched-chain amino acid transport system substrate-binding protein